MKSKLVLIHTTILSCFILYSCMSQEQQEQVLQNSEPQSVDVTVNVGGDSRAERFLGTFDRCVLFAQRLQNLWYQVRYLHSLGTSDRPSTGVVAVLRRG